MSSLAMLAEENATWLPPETPGQLRQMVLAPGARPFEWGGPYPSVAPAPQVATPTWLS